MTNLFLGFLNRSLSAAVLIFAVVLVRLAFKKRRNGCCAPCGRWRRCGFCARSRLKAC